MFTRSGLKLHDVQVNGFSLKHAMGITGKQEQANISYMVELNFKSIGSKTKEIGKT